jgi:hypothetical protein
MLHDSGEIGSALRFVTNRHFEQTRRPVELCRRQSTPERRSNCVGEIIERLRRFKKKRDAGKSGRDLDHPGEPRRLQFARGREDFA